MKNPKILASLSLLPLVLAQAARAEKLLFQNAAPRTPVIQQHQDEMPSKNRVAPKNSIRSSKPKNHCPLPESKGNLPEAYTKICRNDFTAEGIYSIVPRGEKTPIRLVGLQKGDEVYAYLQQSIKASATVPTSIRTKIVKGAYEGGTLFGYAKLDLELKRVLFEFSSLLLPGEQASYSLAANGHALNGQIGLEGDHHSGELNYAATAFSTYFVAGALDASVNRNTTAYGTQVPEQSLGNQIKGGAAIAASKEGQRLMDKASHAPEYTEIEGGQLIRVIITQNPIEERN